ncbi:GM19248 [Drosophila sechellia]|uniref:GM19248 n=1 Tax=Drosophila sechellia TaxID=7238 RepID=B4I9Z6_DROSE|nr:GM19248 [Drosophila sechellia]
MMNGKIAEAVVLNCRTCTRACKLHKPLQEEIDLGSEGSTTLASMLNYCAGLSFEPQDGAAMPQHICLHCLQLLEQAFNFKRMVIESDDLLRQALDEAVGTSFYQSQIHSPNQSQQHDQQLQAFDSEEYLMIEMLNEEQENIANVSSYHFRVQWNAGALVHSHRELTIAHSGHQSLKSLILGLFGM